MKTHVMSALQCTHYSCRSLNNLWIRGLRSLSEDNRWRTRADWSQSGGKSELIWGQFGNRVLHRVVHRIKVLVELNPNYNTIEVMFGHFVESQSTAYKQ